MSPRRFPPTIPLAALLAALGIAWTSAASAQEDLFGGDQKPAAAAKKPVAAKAPAPAKSAPPIAVGPAEDPVVTALLNSNPTTPADIFHTAQVLLEAGRPELAKKYLRFLLDAKPSDEQWAALVEQYHTSAFTDLAEHAELRPESELIVQAALGGSNRELRDPGKLAEEIKQLQDPSPAVRGRALSRLRGAHAAAIDALIAALADPQRAAEHPAVRAALVAMRSEAIDPLADMLDRADPEFMVEAIRTLAAMRATKAIVYLYAPALAEDSDLRVREPARAAVRQLLGYLPTPATAARQLHELAERYFAGKEEFNTDINSRVTLWTWDAVAKKCIARSCRPDDAARVFAARLARAARQLSPGDRAAQVLAVATELEQMVYDRGLDKGLDFNDAEVKRLAATGALPGGSRLLEEVMAFCLARGHTVAATAAAELVGRGGSAGQSLVDDGSPLVRAVRSPDARLRVAAAEAIARLKPQSPFAGSSFVLESLAFQAASTGGRRALAVSPNDTVLQEWIGMLKFRNIESDTVASGGEAVRMAYRCPDYEVAVIDMLAQTPAAEEIVQRLHGDYRTANLRIALLCGSATIHRARQIAANDPLVIAFSQPIDAVSARWQWGRINALAPREFVGYSEREKLAVRALDCLARLSDASRPLFDFQKAEAAALSGLQVPRLSAHAVVLLSNIATRESQQALVDVADRTANPPALRKAGAVAFDINVTQFGLLLSADSVRRQYRRYRQSADEAAAAQQALASVLSTIESRATPSMLELARRASAAEKPAQPKKAKP